MIGYRLELSGAQEYAARAAPVVIRARLQRRHAVAPVELEHLFQRFNSPTRVEHWRAS